MVQEILEIDGQPYVPGIGCTVGDTFSIRLKVNYTQNSSGGATRYDLATFVAENGGLAVGGAACSVGYLSPVTTGTPDLVGGDGPFRDEDGDACGDLLNTDKPTNSNLQLSNLLCQDGNGDGRLDISYLVSWQQNDSNACDAAAINAGDTATLLPGTSSKCLYEAEADLDVIVEQPPSIAVVKTAAPTSAQVGDTITYTVAIQNLSDATDPVTITSLTDNLNGADMNLDGVGTCSLPTIAAGAAYSCTFTASYSAEDIYSDVVSVSGTDDEGEPVSAQDTASVTITAAPPSPDPAIRVVKTVAPLELDEPGGAFTYFLVIQNTGNVDGIVITALNDVVNGVVTTSLNRQGTCSLPTPPLDVGETYSCELTVNIDSQPATVTDIVEATWNPPGEPSRTTDSNQVQVTIRDLPSSIRLTKSADRQTLTTPGGDVTYTVTIDNESVADTVTIDTLDDNLLGDLNGVGDCAVPQTLAPGASYSCSLTENIDITDGQEHTNIVTASGTDDDGADVSGTDGATVIGERPPSIEVAKTASPTSAQLGDTVTYTVGVVNTSSGSDPVTITSLIDDIHGNITLTGGDVVSTSCTLPQTIPPGDFYGCQFEVAYLIEGTYDNTVTASGTDDDGEAVSGQGDASVEVTVAPPPPSPAVEVVKSATPRDIDEPGGTVTYSVRIQNTGNVDGLEITVLTDNLYGDITTAGHDGITVTNCSLPQPLAQGAAYTCSFTVDVASQPGTVEDIISATWTAPDPPGGTGTSDSNQVTVNVRDVPSTLNVTKTASPVELTVPGGDVSYTLTLQNPSPDEISLTTLTDDKFGDLGGVGNCQVPLTIPPGGTYSCNFSQALTIADGEEHVNLVTASGVDDDGADVSGSGSATVTGERAPSITVAKTAAPIVAQVGESVTYTIEITNTSAPTDPVRIDSLTDEVAADDGPPGPPEPLDGKGTCTLPQTIQPAATYRCEFTEFYQVAAVYKDVVTASGADDEGEAVSGQNDEAVQVTVSIGPPPPSPAIKVTKAGTPLDLDEPGGTVTYSITVVNIGNVDGLEITTLSDNLYGDITTTGHDGIRSTNCFAPQDLAAGADYSCEFTVDVVSQPGTIADVVTVGADTGLAPPDDALTVVSNEVTVTVRDVASTIDVIKTASPDQLPAPGGDVTYTVTLDNPSADEIQVTTLTDDMFGDLAGVGDCELPQTIPPGSSYSCSFTETLTLTDGAQHTNTVTASGTDDDGADATGSGEATVTGTTSASPPAPIPTMAQWLLALLASVLAAAAFRRIRQQARGPR